MGGESFLSIISLSSAMCYQCHQNGCNNFSLTLNFFYISPFPNPSTFFTTFPTHCRLPALSYFAVSSEITGLKPDQIVNHLDKIVLTYLHLKSSLFAQNKNNILAR